MAVTDVVQLSVEGSVQGQQHVHTLHFKYLSVGANEQGLIDAWQSACRTAYRTVFSTVDSPCQLYVARQVCGASPLREATEEAEVSPNIAGATTVSGDYAPSWLASVHVLRSGLAGRRYRGRFFLGGLSEAEINGNSITGNRAGYGPAYATALLGAFGPAGTVATDYRLCVYSRKLRSTGATCTECGNAVNTVQNRTAIGSMRSRRPGSGA